MAASTSILSNIAQVEDDIKKCTKKIQTIEKTLKLKGPKTELQEKLQQEVSELKKTLKCQEDDLHRLQHENRRTGATALFVLILLGFLFYFSMMLVMQLFLPSDDVPEKHS